MNISKNNTSRTVGMLLFLMLLSKGQASPCILEQQGRREIKETLSSHTLEEERTIVVSLPADYDAGEGNYTVLFFLDAESLKGWKDCISSVESLNAKGIAPEMIVVGIWNTVRNRDMIPAVVAHRPGSGGSLRFLDFLTIELIPHIQQKYRISGFSILYGASNAGLFTVFALLEAPETFRAYIASSPMIGHCPDYIQEKVESFVSRTNVEECALYMIYGDQDSERVTRFVPALQEFLDSNAPERFRSRLDILRGEGHVPESSLSRGLNYIFTRADNPHASGKTLR
ncbi:MAG: alpha/beta hydrolase [Candidatus Aminicenantaceae bacterium]